MDIIKAIEHEHLKEKIPVLKVGNTVRVHQRIKEGNRERIQVFEGIIIKKQNGGINATFTVRRIASGVGVEKTFLVHSPLVEKVELVRVGKARRARLYYLRDRLGKAAKTREMVGARIENKEITIKGVQAEEVKAEEVESKAEVKEEKVTEKSEVKENKVETKTEAKAEVKEEKTDVKAEAKEETKTEAKEAKAEAKAETKETAKKTESKKEEADKKAE